MTALLQLEADHVQEQSLFRWRWTMAFHSTHWRVARALSADGSAKIIALHVYEMPQGSVSAYLDKDAVVADAYERAREVNCWNKVEGLEGREAPNIVKGHTARTIIDYAAEHAVRIASSSARTSPDLSDYFLGSTASRVVRHAPCAVHVHRGV